MFFKTNQIYKEPNYYHREYENDLPKKDKIENKAFSQCIRVSQVALPFLSLYKPFSQHLSIVLGGTRVVSSFSQMVIAVETKDTNIIGKSVLEVAIALTALACSIFTHPLGMLVTTAHDMIINVIQLTRALEAKDYKKAFDK